MSDNYEERAERAKVMNQQIIEAFHAHGGKVGNFPGNFLLLHTRGAKSNQPRLTPVSYFEDGDTYVLVAAKGGAPTNPDWYYNMLAHPDEISIEVGTDHFNVHVTVAEPAERDRLFADVVRQAPNFGEYQKETSRILPVVLLKRVNER
jgi:deazaflavin-dependent oxidoreductase (nitroreductase family)